jgi:predicted metal-dependent hydrolase
VTLAKAPMHEVREIHFGTRRMPYRLYRSGRRTLEIAVTAAGEVEVRAPNALPLRRVEERLRARSLWIRRRQLAREVAQPAVTPRSYQSGESHRYLGRQYRLTLASADRAEVRICSGRLCVSVPDPRDATLVRRALDLWLVGRAKVVLPERLSRLLLLPAFRELQPTAVRIQRMRQRWGSCASSGRVVLNTGLVRLPVSLIDYVLAHELCHLRARRHDHRFERLLARVMPDWRGRQRRLADAWLE